MKIDEPDYTESGLSFFVILSEILRRFTISIFKKTIEVTVV